MTPSSVAMKQMYSMTLENKLLSEVWTRSKVSYIIDCLNRNNTEVPKYFNLNRFCVTKVNDDVILNRITQDYGFQNVLRLIPCEDAFETIWEAHIADNVHRTLLETMRIIRIDNFIELSNIETVLSLCDVCKDKMGKQIINKQCAVNIVSMTDKPVEDFKFILVYEDLGTGLVQLRPLANNSDVEIAMELYKIFADFGQPDELLVDDPSFFSVTRTKLLHKCSKFLLLGHFKIKHRHSSKKWLKHIRTLMDRLMEYLNVTHWVTLCYVLQWRINNTNLSRVSPHNLAFKNKFLEAQQIVKHITQPPIIPAGNLNHLHQEKTGHKNTEQINVSDNFYGSSTSCSEPMILEILGVSPVLTVKDMEDKTSASCKECGKEILTKLYNCQKCKSNLHLYCGHRIVAAEASIVLIVCKVCRDL